MFRIFSPFGFQKTDCDKAPAKLSQCFMDVSGTAE